MKVSDMIGHYAYTPYIWPMLATALLIVVLGIYTWRRRHLPAAVAFVWMTVFWAIWAAGAAAEIAAVEPETKFFWFQVQAVMKLPAITCQLIFVLIYAGLGKWLNRVTLTLLILACVSVPVMIALNPTNHLYWTAIWFFEDVRVEQGPLFWATFSYILLLFVLECAVLIWLLVHSPRHRWFAGLLLSTALLTRIAATVDFERLNPLMSMDLTILASNFGVFAYFLALFRFRILSVVPIGRDMAIDRMANGILIFDAENLLVDLNPAARKLLALPSDAAIGREAAHALRAYPGILRLLDQGNAAHTEILLAGAPQPRYLQAHASPLVNSRGFSLGRLILFQDVTDQTLARELLAQQKRSLAVLQERERLARELHDSVGQTFAFVNAQGQAIRRLLARGDTNTADEYAARLVEVAREADTDIRESIFGLRVAITEHGLFPALATYLDQYEKRYGIHTGLSRPEALGDGAFDPLVEVQLLRIIQEALTNARKHAQARCVCVAFAVQEESILVTVQDDGCGFDSEHISGESGGRLGLHVMRERAEEIGGCVAVHSESGKGTSVIVTIPQRRADSERGDYADSTRR